jgi:N-acetylglucosaminyl-diphospho-decaprenol L-rhamnosyltransferase
MRSRVTAVVVTYNSREVVGDALDSLKESHDSGVIEGCIVIDNRSADRTADFVRTEHSWCTLIESGENLGFGRASNIGVEHSASPYVLLLNPDAILPLAGIERLVSFLDGNPRAGAVGPAIHDTDGGLQLAGSLPTPGNLLLHALGRFGRAPEVHTIEPGGPPFRANWITGAVVMLRRAMLDEIGVFEPRYFLYFEETDLWFRAQHAGWELWAVGEAVGTHIRGVSAKSGNALLYHGCIAEHYFKSRFYYLVRHFGRFTAMVTEVLEFVIMGTSAAFDMIRGVRPDDFAVRFRAPVLRLPNEVPQGKQRTSLPSERGH